MTPFPKTKYETLTDKELDCIFHADVWKSRSAEDRKHACQELANRTSASLGRDHAPEVSMDSFDGATYGYYQRSSDHEKIVLNEDMVEKGQIQQNMGDSTHVYDLPASNLSVYETVKHECYHGYQDDVANGKIEPCTPDEQRLCKAGNDAYCEPPEHAGAREERILYSQQYIERSARAYANAEIVKANQNMKDSGLREDPMHEPYQQANAHSEAMILQEASDYYRSENVRAEIDQAQINEAEGNSQGKDVKAQMKETREARIENEAHEASAQKEIAQVQSHSYEREM